jgi:uncharacterized protein YtpQ (UPF0354 family)
MKLIKKEKNLYVIEGSGQKFKLLTVPLMNKNNHMPESIHKEEIVKFYQSLIRVSSNDETDTSSIQVTGVVMAWLLNVFALLPKSVETEQLYKAIKRQYEFIQENPPDYSKNSLFEKLSVEYQDILGVENIEKMTAFIEAFELTEEELQRMVIGKFVEVYPSIEPQQIRLDMLERVYHHFFEIYETLLIETHLILPFPAFQKAVNVFMEEEIEESIEIEEDAQIWLYLLYFDMLLKGIEEGFLYQAEHADMVFDWFKPLFSRFATDLKEKQGVEKKWTEEKIDEEKEKDRQLFRDIYIQEISKSFDGLEGIEDDKENPYNVVFVLCDNRRVVCNTEKHYEWYAGEAVICHGKERVHSMASFIEKIAPTNAHTNIAEWTKTAFEDVKERIYPMIRPMTNTPSEAVNTPFVNGLGIYYGIQMQTKEKTHYAIIMNKMLEKWGIEDKDIHQTALKNLENRTPSYKSYYESIEGQIPKEKLEKLPKAYKELLMIAGSSTIDSSYILDISFLTDLMEQWKSDSLVVSIPVRDCILLTKKEHIPLLKRLTKKLYETHPGRLHEAIIEWTGKKWETIE